MANAIANITFTPAIAAGGVGDNAAVTFTANSVAQVTKWDCAVDLEVVQQGFMGLHWLKTAGGFGKWSGSAEVALDYGDAKQAKFVDAIATASPPGVPVGLVLRSATSKQLYGSAVPNGLRITQTVGALVTVAFKFTGDGAILADWH